MNTAPPATVAPETIVYRQQLALHVLPKHPHLSIHHANRLRKLHPTLPPLTPISCPKCENVSLYGRGSVRVFRQEIIKECNVCGVKSPTPRPDSRTRNSFPSVRVARRKSNSVQRSQATDRVAKDAVIEPLAEALTAAVRQDQPQMSNHSKDQSAPSMSKAPGGAIRRQKSKGGLQGMLQRNREREAREANDKNSNSASLSTFLQGL